MKLFRRRQPIFAEYVAGERFAVTTHGARILVGFLDGPACEVSTDEAARLGEWFAAASGRAAQRATARRRRRR